MHELSANPDDGVEAAGHGAVGFAPDQIEGGGRGGGIEFDAADLAGGTADLEGEAVADDLEPAVTVGQVFAAVVHRQNVPFAFDHQLTKSRAGRADARVNSLR